MQSGFGGVSEMQQFMVDNCSPSLFSSPPPQNSNPNPNPNLNASIDHLDLHHHHHHHHHQKFHPLPHPHHPLHLHPQANPPPHFAHFGHSIPITQQLFHQQQQQQQQQQQHPQHHFQLFQHHLGLDQESGPENSNSSAAARMMGSGGGGFLAAMNFKLGVNESSPGGGGGTSRDGLNEDDGILQGDDGSESRLHSWHTEDDSASIKEPFWRPLDIDYINPNNKRPAESKHGEEISSNKLFKKLAKETSSSINEQNRSNNNNTNTTTNTTDSNYKLFSELEAIYKPGGSGGGGGSGPITNYTSNNNNNNNQTGSGSALTGDDNPIQLPAVPTVQHQLGNGSDTSNGGENPSPVKPHKNIIQKGSSSSSGRGKRAKRRQKKQLTSIATFFESLVKQLMDHQENLHQKFLQVMEKKDLERTQREEAWRKQEAVKASREAAVRAQQRALSASRESAIISFLEKITGETLDLPVAPEVHKEEKEKEEKEKEKDNFEDAVDNITQNSIELYNADSGNNMNSSGISSSRWPKAEVQALIRVRSGLESRFQEPGLKGPLWEEVSTTMGTLGYIRSSKRCKEKWENINKYFRKTKDSGKKRPVHSKTCPYFHQLDQLYSKSLANNNSDTLPLPSSNNNVNDNKDTNSELLDAIVVSNNDNNKFSGTNVDEGEKDEEGEINEEEGEGENSQEQARDRHNFLNQEHHQLFNSIRS